MEKEKNLTHRVKHLSKTKACTLCGNQAAETQFKGHSVCCRCLEFVKTNF